MNAFANFHTIVIIPTCLLPYSPRNNGRWTTNQLAAHRPLSAAPVIDAGAQMGNSQAHTRPSHTAPAAKLNFAAAATLAAAVASIAAVKALVAVIGVAVVAGAVEHLAVYFDSAPAVASSVAGPVLGMEDSAKHWRAGQVARGVSVEAGRDCMPAVKEAPPVVVMAGKRNSANAVWVAVALGLRCCHRNKSLRFPHLM